MSKWTSQPPKSGPIWWWNAGNQHTKLLLWHGHTKTWNLMYDFEELSRWGTFGDRFQPAIVPGPPQDHDR